MGFRIGHGYDLHRLQAHGALLLGGVKVAENLSPVAHSDGDVVIHALVDAILGALALGDIGEHFPDSDARWKNAASRIFIAETKKLAEDAGYRVGNVDIIVLAERPKLKAYKLAIRESLAKMLAVPVGDVSLKAGTNEGCDAIGRGEAIAAHAVVMMVARESGQLSVVSTVRL